METDNIKSSKPENDTRKLKRKEKREVWLIFFFSLIALYIFSGTVERWYEWFFIIPASLFIGTLVYGLFVEIPERTDPPEQAS